MWGPTWLEMLECSNWWSPAPTRPINTFVCLIPSFSIPGNASIGRSSHKKSDLPTVGCDRQEAESFGWQSTPQSHLGCTGHTHTHRSPLSPLDPFLLFGTDRFGEAVCARQRSRRLQTHDCHRSGAWWWPWTASLTFQLQCGSVDTKNRSLVPCEGKVNSEVWWL